MGNQTITVRRMHFKIPESLDPVLIRGEPEESFVLVGLSLLLPYLEPYLIRTMNQARARIDDPELLAHVRKFSAQEGQHYREHQRYNQAIRSPRYPKLAQMEQALASDYARFTRDKSLRFNLAYAEGFEAMTAATALYLLETRDRREMLPCIEDVMFWHAIEELEHRTVAFDVYQQLYGGYLYRLAIGLYAQVHLLRFSIRVARYLLTVERERVAGYGGRGRRLFRQASLLARRFLPRILKTYSPWYSPRNIQFTPMMEELAARLSAQAQSTS